MIIEAVILDEAQEFFLSQISDDGSISLYKCSECEKVSKFDPIVQLIYDFENKFNKHVTCWEKMISIEGRQIYAVRVDMEEINKTIEESEEFMLISLNDIMNIDEIKKDTRWLVMMSLDTKIRNKKICNE
jgi:hypothetical protein